MKLPSMIQFADKKVQKAFVKLEKSTEDKKQLHGFLVRAFNDVEKMHSVEYKYQRNRCQKNTSKNTRYGTYGNTTFQTHGDCFIQ